MINNRKTFSISYFLGRSFFLGYGFSLLSKILNKDAWIAAILGTILGCGIIFLLQKGKEKLNTPLKEIDSWIKWPFIILFFLFSLFVFTQIIFIFQTFASSFFLIKSPVYFIVLPIPFLIYRISKTGMPTIAKVAEILMPISIILMLFSFVGLGQNFNLNFFKPIFTTDTFSLIKGTLFFSFYSTAPYFLLLNTPLEKNKLVGKYLFTSLSIIILCFFIIGILGPNLMEIYRYPEYMTMKKIKMFNFIEKVENIVSIAWLFDSFITLAVAGMNLKEIIPKKKQNIIFGILLFLLYLWALVSNTYYQEGLYIYHIIPIILGIFEGLFFLLLLFKKKKKG